MTGTRRTPIGRHPGPKITPAAIRLFEAMRRVRCTCAPIDWNGKYWERQQCQGCKRWWSLHSDLCDALGSKPWEWPRVEDPDAQNPYPPGCNAHLTWEPNRRAQAMWLALATASREARREALRARKAAEQNTDLDRTNKPTPPPAS